MTFGRWLGCGYLLLATTLGCSSSTGDEMRPQTAGDSGASAQGESGNGAGGNGAGGAPSATLEAPDEEQSLLAFLDAQEYAGWPKEDDYHPSAGPHGDQVRVYYSPKAAAALNSGAATFPAGAAAVKELASGGSVYGYSVWVKVQDATDAGNGFYWYEIIRHDDGTSNVYGNGRGSKVCTGCHQAGKDFDLSTLPFE